MKTTLSVDHRVADGAQAGRFLQEFKKLLVVCTGFAVRVAF